MKSLKVVYDAAKAADEEVGRILSAMQAAFEEGTEEGIQRALALRPELDEAKAKAAEANAVYVSMRDASMDENEHARKFVPVSGGAAKAVSQGKVMSRAEYEQLPYDERHAFFKEGGVLVDKLPE